MCAALLLPYFEKSTAQSVRDEDAGDWMYALAEYPEWAIKKATRWWKSDKNPNLRKRPLEGDITSRIHLEMDVVRAFKRKLSWKMDSPAPEARQPTHSEVKSERDNSPEAIAKRKAEAEDIMKIFTNGRKGTK